MNRELYHSVAVSVGAESHDVVTAGIFVIIGIVFLTVIAVFQCGCISVVTVSDKEGFASYNILNVFNSIGVIDYPDTVLRHCIYYVLLGCE